MAAYTVVDENYDVTIYRSLKALTQAMEKEGLYMVDAPSDGDEDPKPATAKQIAAALREDSVVCLYPLVGDWSHRIQRH